MSDVFLSYAREDLERAKVVARALEKHGWSVWWDARIGIGEVFDEVIEKELEAAAAVVVLWSRSSVASRWVRNEASAAEAREKLVPALLEDVMPPLAFRGRQAASLIDWDGEPAHQGFEAVRDAVQALVGQVRVAPIKEEASKRDIPAGAWRSVWTRLVLVVVVGSAGAYAVIRARGGGDQESPVPHPISVATQTPGAEATPPILARSPKPKPSLASPSTPVPNEPTLSDTVHGQPRSVFPATSYRPGMRIIYGGTFTMGSPASEEGRRGDETPHQVTLTRWLYVAETEVTQRQYLAVMEENPSIFSNLGLEHPVENVSWFMALQYCNELSAREGREACYVIGAQEWTSEIWPRGLNCRGYRLPTEAEWEYASRALTQGARYDSLDEIAWYKANSGGKHHPVGDKPPNRWGLKDTLGNVYEWVWDAYAPYTSSAVRDPTGPASGDRRIIRGCCWQNEAAACRAAFRDPYEPSAHAFGLGFRPVRTVATE